MNKNFFEYYNNLKYIGFLILNDKKGKVFDSVDNVRIKLGKIDEKTNSYIINLNIKDLIEILGFTDGISLFLNIKKEKLKKILCGKVKFASHRDYFRWYLNNYLHIYTDDNNNPYFDLNRRFIYHKQIVSEIADRDKDVAKAKLIEKIEMCLTHTSLEKPLRSLIKPLKKVNGDKIQKLIKLSPEFYLKNRNCYKFLAESLNFNFNSRVELIIRTYKSILKV